VVFPFGETKIAAWEPDLKAWTVRFLIDAATRDGTYWVLVRITHRDGAVEELRMPYDVDTAAPAVQVSMRAGERPGTYLIRAEQDPASFRADGARDLTRVEVVFPDGRSLRLDSQSNGDWFEELWAPRVPVTGPVRLRVVATDRALNESAAEIVVESR
jgi:hypothetical protein